MTLSQKEKTLLNNFNITGIDEVGRGPLAGPVFVASYTITKNTPIYDLVNDSKKLSEKKRDYLYSLLTEDPDSYKVVYKDAHVIDNIGIVKSIKISMEESIEFNDNYILIDGIFKDKFNFKNYETVIKGDSTHYSIAAASIIAKVERDKLMEKLDGKYPGYYFKNNKGYGTKEHIESIIKNGPCEIHRQTFISNFIWNYSKVLIESLPIIRDILFKKSLLKLILFLNLRILFSSFFNNLKATSVSPPI